MVGDRTEESGERTSVLGEGALTTTGGWRTRRRTGGETYRPGDRQQRTGDDLEDRSVTFSDFETLRQRLSPKRPTS